MHVRRPVFAGGYDQIADQPEGEGGVWPASILLRDGNPFGTCIHFCLIVRGITNLAAPFGAARFWYTGITF